MTRHWWYRILMDASINGNADLLNKLHPMSSGTVVVKFESKYVFERVNVDLPFLYSVDINYTRPLFPFNCQSIGGCGEGTRRVYNPSCAIDRSFKNMQEAMEYDWNWMK